MPRVYHKGTNKRKYQSYSQEDLLKAVGKVEVGATLYTRNWKKYDIPFQTISKKMRKEHVMKVGRPTILSEAEEAAIVNGILCLADWGFPVDRWKLQKIVRHYVSTCGQANQFKKGIPGEGFISGFITRHRKELQLRLVSNYSRKRASIDSVVLNQYFDHLEKSLEGVPQQNIFNYDETNLSDNPGMKKCLVRRGNKYPSRIMNESKGAISIMFCGSAAGELLPPYVCYKSKGIFSTWRVGGPKGTRYGRSKSGWFEMATFENWFFSIALPQLKKLIGPKALMGDNLSSHMSVKVIAACKQNDIRFIC